MEGYWDIHNHILPGLDDGSSCMEETLEMLQAEYEQGVRYIIFTPHYREGMFEISSEARVQVYNQVKNTYLEYYKDEMPGMYFGLGCELHMHPSQLEKAAGRVYRMPGTNMVLAEFSGIDDYTSIRLKLNELRNNGYRCVIAHVERYKLNARDIEKLRSEGSIYIQVNAGSILGQEGMRQRRLARALLEEKQVDLIGSDAHNTTSRLVNIGSCAEWIIKTYGQEYADRLLKKNPKEIFLKR